jgi:RNA polymerase sigma factor (sigma-70 family)
MTDETIGCNLKAESRSKRVDEDEHLIKAAQRDPEAFGRLYDKYYQQIFNYIYRRTLDVSLTEDLTAETFFSALRYIGGFRWRRVAFSAWLYRIATNEVNKHHRRQAHAPVSLDTSDEKSQQWIDSLEDPSVASDTSLVQAETYARLHQTLLTLKPKYQTVIVLRFFEDKTIAQISDITGKRQGTVKSLLHRGLRQLRELSVKEQSENE